LMAFAPAEGLSASGRRQCAFSPPDHRRGDAGFRMRHRGRVRPKR